MFDIGFQELVIIFVVALLVFGPEKLPELARTIGKWMTEIKRGVYIAKGQIESELNVDYKLPDEDLIKNLPKDTVHENNVLPEADATKKEDKA
ncbi:MAG: twin-arginine translocase subunit TatB [Nitrospirae bacterium]|nr:twin-arginine translocase subunit TatB [Nitrospirota bacterium]